MKRSLALAISVSILFAPFGTAYSAQSILLNASMEEGPGPNAEDPMIPADWTLSGSVIERSAEANLVPAGPSGHALKAFRSQDVESAYQELAVTVGQQVAVSASLYTKATDKLSGGGTTFAAIRLAFFNNTDQQFGSTFQSTVVLNSSSPADTWIPVSIPAKVVPSGATKARMTCILSCPAGTLGACFWDDCKLTVNAGPNALANGDFESAGFGEASPTGIDEWQGFNDQQQSSDFAFHGDKSVKVGTDDFFSGLLQTRTGYLVQDGDRLLLRARVWHSSTNGLTGSARAGLKLEFEDTGSSGLPSPYENLEFNTNSTTNAWVEVDLGTTGLEVPEDASKARVTLIFAPNMGSNGEVFFDAAFASADAGPNLLLNPSFEVGGVRPTDWSYFETAGESYALLSAFEIPGYPDEEFDACAKAGGDNFAGFYQDVDVTPGQTFDAHVQMYMRHETKLQGSSRAGIKIEWRTGLPGQVDITTGPSDNTITAASPPDTWIPLEIDFTMPAGTEAYPRLVTIVATGNGSGAAYFDACELVVLNKFNGADSDGDDDEDLRDFAEFQRCFNGDGASDLGWNCSVFDNDEDIDVDLIDFAYFEANLLGPLP